MTCVGCDRPGTRLCQSCAARFAASEGPNRLRQLRGTLERTDYLRGRVEEVARRRGVPLSELCEVLDRRWRS